jgi:glycosyltransferase involved in cell wall biosynthesis
MGNAIATFTPTEYLEPFCGVHIESMLTGTPPITTNFGVFPETIPDNLDGKVGFRCNTLRDFVEAAKKAKQINRKSVHSYAQRFIMDNVKHEYQRWFDDLHQLYLSSKDSGAKGWHYLG